MCIHCCRLRRTPCPPIPYSCPHCPVRTISSCCPLGSRPIAENAFMKGGDLEQPPDPCGILPPRWLEVNRRVIYALANHLDRSPEAAHYMLLRLLYANYRKVMVISRKRRSFRVPLSGFPDQDLFSASGLFDSNGYLYDPMAPETLGKLLRMMQDYIFRLRALNLKYKWFENGDDLRDILHLLGEQDELVKLLRELFADSDVVPIPQLLRALNELEFNNILGKWKKKIKPWLVRSISDLYSEVTEPKKTIRMSPLGKGNRFGPPQSVQGTTIPINLNKSPKRSINNIPITTIKSIPTRSLNSIPKTSIKCMPTTSIKSNPKTNIKLIPTNCIKSIPSQNRIKVNTLQSHPSSIQLKATYLQSKKPTLLFGAFDAKKSSTWESRHADSNRMMPYKRPARGGEHLYRNVDEHRGLGIMRRGSATNEKSFGSAKFGNVCTKKELSGSTRTPSTNIKSLSSKPRKC
ncbi:uncharacterized protein LOC108052601 [Drosophila rhopaloa]|uniref:Uncharacterized protein LOC108052601 n=1 Tax=Drosophila rhopaloa TaxID=1041015 RepID=A0A6P4FZC7_DRORH|nr:uncharacterized protein LOC108052601 [Drosophila rhopaloa]